MMMVFTNIQNSSNRISLYNQKMYKYLSDFYGDFFFQENTDRIIHEDKLLNLLRDIIDGLDAISGQKVLVRSHDLVEGSIPLW